MFYYSFKLPWIDHGFMTEKAVKAVMDEVNPCERVDFSKLTEDEINEYIEVWLSGLGREYVEEFASDVIFSDPLLFAARRPDPPRRRPAAGNA